MVKKRGPYHKDKKNGREERLKLKMETQTGERNRVYVFQRENVTAAIEKIN
jgi:hypothetical protein